MVTNLLLMSLSFDNTGDSKGQGCSYSREKLLLI